MSMGSVRVDIAPGDLIDKITILVIKSERMNDSAKLKNVCMELDILSATRDKAIRPSTVLDELTNKLKAVNERLWIIEDDIRDCEAAKNFGSNFIKNHKHEISSSRCHWFSWPGGTKSHR